jgi:hypothetical protein
VGQSPTADSKHISVMTWKMTCSRNLGEEVDLRHMLFVSCHWGFEIMTEDLSHATLNLLKIWARLWK